MLILLVMLACDNTVVQKEKREVKVEALPVFDVEEQTTAKEAKPSPVEPEEILVEEPAEPIEPVILNPKEPTVDLLIYRHKDSGCYMLVPTGTNEGTLNPVYQRIPTDCPEEMLGAAWDNCLEGEFRQVGESCECQVLVGKPLPTPTPVACPSEDPEEEAEEEE